MRYDSYLMKRGVLPRLLLVSLAVGAVMVAGSVSAATYIVRFGQPNADIVISNNPPRMVTLAASELQKYVFKITGATLPIVTVPAASNHIYVGRSAYTDGFGLSDTGLPHDAFRMVSGSNWLALLGYDANFTPPQPYAVNNSDIPRMLGEWDGLTGHTWGNPNVILYKDWSGTKLDGIWKYDRRGSLNAVNEYLRGLGVRWFFPGDIGEVVPTLPELALPSTNVTVHPDFAYRNMYILYHQFAHEDATTNEILWQLRLGINGGRESIGLAWPAHGILDVISRDEVKQAHPEYYQMKNGVRDTTNDFFGPCLSSDGLYSQNVAYAKAVYFIYSNDAPSVSVMPTDGYGTLCECPLCVGKSTPSRGYSGTLSDYVWSYVNRVATNLYASHPDRKVTCCAYTTYQLPPTNIATLCTNIVMGWCAWRTDFRDPAVWAAYTNQVAAWMAVLPSKQYFRYDYYAHSDRDLWGGVPVYFPQLIAKDLSFQKGKSLGECIEVYHNYGPNGDTWNAMAANHLNVYVTARLYWDASQDVNALLDDYYQKFYGPVAAQMKAFVEYSEAHWSTMRNSKPEMDAALALLDAAGAAAGSGVYSQRIDLLVEYVKPLRALRDAMTEDHYVARTGQTPVYPYTNWATAASNIQEAVDLAWTNTTVWVGAGRYTVPPQATNYVGPNVVYIRRPVTVRAADGAPQNTVIDGQGTCRGVTMYYPDNSGLPFVLDGFTISNCYATNRGGGLLLESENYAWTGVVQNCVFSDNTVAGDDGNLYPAGGAVYAYTAAGALGVVMSNCWIRGNQSTNRAVGSRSEAGGVFLRNSGQKLFAGCVIENNRAGLGGGVYSSSGTLTFENTIIRDNGAVMSENAIWGGGGIYLGSSDLSMRNCLIYGNRALRDGGAIANQSQSSNFVMELRNCTVVSNVAGGSGGGIYIRERSVALGGTPTLRLYNSIVYSNTSDNLSLAVVTPYPSNFAYNSCFTPTNLMLGSTNRIIVVNCLSNNPLFAGYAAADFRLSSNSPCINTGTNQDWMPGARDLGGQSRIMSGTVDMGCYEYGLPKGVMVWMR